MSLQLVQILLPLYNKQGKAFPRIKYDRIRQELTDIYGGITIFARAPAIGLWENSKRLVKDDIVIFEVMTETLDSAWRRNYRKALEQGFKQDEIVIRSQAIRLL